MSEDISFRVWYPSVKKMRHFSDGVIIADDLDRYGMFFPCQEGNVFLSECEVMRFTGLHDKNGKEIYEGDIIRYSLEPYGTKGTFTLPVIFINGQFRTERGTVYAVHLICEVIGNIYENPELLEVSKC